MNDVFSIHLHDGLLDMAEHLTVKRTDLINYKSYCFHGHSEFLYRYSCLEGYATTRTSFLRAEWEFMDFACDDYVPFETLSPKPKHFEEMLGVAKALPESTPFVCVDLFEANGKYQFSEMTLCPCGGFMPFTPKEAYECLGVAFEMANSIACSGKYGD